MILIVISYFVCYAIIAGILAYVSGAIGSDDSAAVVQGIFWPAVLPFAIGFFLAKLIDFKFFDGCNRRRW